MLLVPTEKMVVLDPLALQGLQDRLDDREQLCVRAALALAALPLLVVRG